MGTLHQEYPLVTLSLPYLNRDFRLKYVLCYYYLHFLQQTRRQTSHYNNEMCTIIAKVITGAFELVVA